MTLSPFEATGQVTSVAAENTFISAMVSANPDKVTRQVIGQSYNGSDIYILRFGGGPGRPVVMGTGAHGNENMPRESIFALIRDLCETSHPWQEMLTERELIIVPTINPDGQPFDRNNGADVNINRSYTDLTPLAPEARALVEFYYTIDPIVIYDGHEWELYGAGRTFQVGTSTRVSVDRELQLECLALGNTVKAAIEGGGYTFDIPPNWYDFDTPGGALTHWTGQVGVIGLVTETMFPLAHVGPGRSDRFSQNNLAQATLLTYVAENVLRLEAVSTSARERIASKLSRGDYTWTLDLQRKFNGKAVPPGTPTVSAIAYIIDPEDMATVAPILDAHGIIRTGNRVDLNQPRAGLATSLLDPLAEADTRIASATRVAPPDSHEPVWVPPAPPNRDLDVIVSVTW